MQSISRNEHCMDRATCIPALPSAYQEYISGDIEIDDVTCGTKSTITQDILDMSYAGHTRYVLRRTY